MNAGLVGFLVVLALVLAAVLLFRSMSKHMRRVPESFDTTDEHRPDGAGADADQSSGRD